jgi:hypothetical protein
MGFLNNIKDRFQNAEFSVKPQKKLKTLSREFEEEFGLELVFYKGKKIAEESLTLSQLNAKTADDVHSNSDNTLKIKASHRVLEVEKAFKSSYGTTVQIKRGGILVDNDLTLGQAARGEDNS